MFKFTPFLPPPPSDETDVSDGENQTPRRRSRLTHAHKGSPRHPQPRNHPSASVAVGPWPRIEGGGEDGRVADRGEHGSSYPAPGSEVDNPVEKLELDGVHHRVVREHATDHGHAIAQRSAHG